MSKLFLDDSREPPDSSWDVVRSYAEFVEYIEKNAMPEVISFDHDLAAEHYPYGDERSNFTIPYEQFKEKTGYDCAKWLVDRRTLPNTYWIHSLNPKGRENIKAILDLGYSAAITL